jgi:anti-anti-sigma factor
MNEQSNNTTAVIHPEGDLVLAAMPPLRSRLREMVGAGILHLTLDLRGVQTVDSSGIALVVATHNSLKKAGGDLTVINASKDVLDLFHAMRIHQHLRVSGVFNE